MPCTWDTLQLKFKFNDRDTWYHRFYQELFYEKKIKVNVKQIRKSYKLIPFYAYSTENLICFIIELKKYRWFNLFWLPNCICTTFFNRKACILKYIYPSSNIPNQKHSLCSKIFYLLLLYLIRSEKKFCRDVVVFTV